MLANQARWERVLILLECSKICLFKRKASLFFCIYCDQGYEDPAKFREHNGKHDVKPTDIRNAIAKIDKPDLLKADVTDVSCKLCDTTIERLDNLLTHLLEIHDKKIEPHTDIGILPFKMNLDDYRCALCDEKYTDYKTLNYHMNMHYPRFVCDQCGSGFATALRLKSHVTTHETGYFPCKACVKVFRSKAAMNGHYSYLHMKVKKHSCPQCPEKFSNYFQRSKHLSLIHGMKEKFSCNFCMKVFNAKGPLSSHVRATHLKERRHACDSCNATFYSKTCLKKHMVKHTGNDEPPNKTQEDIFTRNDTKKQVILAKRDKRQRILILLECSRLFLFKQRGILFMCIYCDQRYLDPAKLRQHNAEHEDVKPIEIERAIAGMHHTELYKADITDVSCKLCDTPIDTLDDLTKHLYEKHNKKIDPNLDIGILPFKINLDDYKCVLCEEKYPDYNSLSHHMNVHYPRFVCEQCGSGFVTAMRLKSHALRHETGSFPCKACNKVFTSKAAMNAHYAFVHKNAKTRRCPYCPEKFSNVVQRLNHLSTIHGIKLAEYKCNFCPKVFNLKGRLSLHVRSTHLKEKHHRCDVCDAQFFGKTELARHMNMHTGEKKYQCNVCQKAYGRNYHLIRHMRSHSK